MDTEQPPQNTSIENENQPVSKKERRELRREEKRTATTSLHKARSLRRVVLWVVAIAAIGGAIAGVTYLAISSGEAPNGKETLLTNSLTPSDWIRGNAASSVSLIEYGDFQCPACGQYHPIVKKLEEEFGSSIAFSFRHFPLSQVHPNAKAAARAAEAAGEQGKFWEMHDLLFERQSEWSPKPSPKSTFITYATELGLDINKFENDMDRADIDDKITSHYQSGIASGVNSTPTFFLNGVKLENIRSYDDFQRVLSKAVEAATTPTASDTAATTTPIHETNP